METIKAQVDLVQKIVTAKEDAERAGVDDPARIILETIKAKNETEIFLSNINQ